MGLASVFFIVQTALADIAGANHKVIIYPDPERFDRATQAAGYWEGGQLRLVLGGEVGDQNLAKFGRRLVTALSGK